MLSNEAFSPTKRNVLSVAAKISLFKFNIKAPKN